MSETTTEMVRRDESGQFELDQRRAKAYSESGYWPDAASVARALVKIEAGRSLNLPPIVAMSEIHVIDGKPGLGAGALAALVKTSGRYDYRVVRLDNEVCELQFFDRGEPMQPTSVFTMQDAERAGLPERGSKPGKPGPWKTYPRNMLFARAMSNGVAWHCPDVTSGRIYDPEELDGDYAGVFVMEEDLGPAAPEPSASTPFIDPDDIDFGPVATPTPPEQHERLCSDAQAGLILARAHEWKLTDEQRHRLTERLTGQPSSKGVPAHMVDAVIQEIEIEGLTDQVTALVLAAGDEGAVNWLADAMAQRRPLTESGEATRASYIDWLRRVLTKAREAQAAREAKA